MSSEGDYVCPVCDGAGSLTINPSSIGDPQCEIEVSCFCGGSGLVRLDELDDAWDIAVRDFGRRRFYDGSEAEPAEYAGW